MTEQEKRLNEILKVWSKKDLWEQAQNKNAIIAQLRHRAEVAERAFDNTMKVFHEVLSAIFPDKKIDFDGWKKDNLAIAEKELAEENKK